MWIEWKFVHVMPKRHKPKLSKLQATWLNARYDQGQNVAVLVGSLEGTAIYLNKSWTSQQKVGKLYDRQQIADWITTNLT
jgi:hypothetical protein